MTKRMQIDASNVPSIIVNYYDRGPSARRVIKIYVQMLRNRKDNQYVVAHSWGTDWWRQDQWGDWKLWKSTDSSGERSPISKDTFKD